MHAVSCSWYHLATTVSARPEWWHNGSVLALPVIDINCSRPDAPPCGLGLLAGVPCCMVPTPVWDHRVPAFQATFIDTGLRAVDDGMNGCFLDAGGRLPPWGCLFPDPAQQDP